MIPYFINLFMIFLYGGFAYIVKTKNSKKILLFVCSLQLLIFSAFRDFSVGGDMPSYVSYFDLLKSIPIESFSKLKIETGYLMLNKVIEMLGGDFAVVLFVISLIIILCIFIFIKENSENYFFAIILFITLNHLAMSFNIVRQYMAIAIVCFAYKFLRKKKIIKYSICIMIASTFHVSALIFIPIGLFCLSGLTNKKILIFNVVSLISVVVLPSISDKLIASVDRYEMYKTMTGGWLGPSSLSIKYILILFCELILVIMGLICAEKTRKKDADEYNNLMILSFFVSISVIIMILSCKVSIVARFASYFSIYMIILIPKVMDRLIKNKKGKVTAYVFIIVLLIAYYYSILHGNIDGLTPYIWRK